MPRRLNHEAPTAGYQSASRLKAALLALRHVLPDVQRSHL
jgi:hypothetical protein